nr:uncharacterized protein K02A2.6-like [Dermacentor andersoni]
MNNNGDRTSLLQFLEFNTYVKDGDEDFNSYVDRFDHYWKVTQIEDGNLKKSTFITALGSRLYKTLKDLLLPATPENKSFEDVVSVLKEHLAPVSQVIARRFKFNRRHQLEMESVSAFAIELRHMAAKCTFGTFLDDALRDRFVVGLRNVAIQATLLKRKELNFETACDLAKAAELAERESKSFRSSNGNLRMDEAIHAVSKKGHLQQKPRIYAKLPRKPELTKCLLELQSYGGTPLETTGQTHVSVEYETQKKTLPVIVVPGTQPCLLGRDCLVQLKLNWNPVFNVEAEQKVKVLLQMYLDVFSPQVGLIKGYEAKTVLKEEAHLVFCNARPVPYALKNVVEQELLALKDRGILQPVMQSDWATPLVVVSKPEHKERLCGDYKVMLNSFIKTEHYPLPLVEDIFAVLSVKDKMLKGLEGVVCYLDDVPIAEASIEECQNWVEAVLARFQLHRVARQM